MAVVFAYFFGIEIMSELTIDRLILVSNGLRSWMSIDSHADDPSVHFIASLIKVFDDTADLMVASYKQIGNQRLGSWDRLRFLFAFIVLHVMSYWVLRFVWRNARQWIRARLDRFLARSDPAHAREEQTRLELERQQKLLQKPIVDNPNRRQRRRRRR